MFALLLVSLVFVGCALAHCDVTVDASGGASAYSRLSDAQVAVRRLRAAAAAVGAAPRPLVVCIAPGVYHETLLFTSADAGLSADAPTIYARVGDGPAVISGALNVSLVPAGGGLWSADLSSIPDLPSLAAWNPRYGNGGCAPAPLELLFGGAPMTCARWPNAGADEGTAPGYALTEWAAPRV